MLHDPKIYNSTVQDSCINPINRLKSCGENYAFEKQHFAEGPTYLLLHINTYFSAKSLRI